MRVTATAVLNGIAYNEAQGRLLVTGKLWPYLYEIELELDPDAAVTPTGGASQTQ